MPPSLPLMPRLSASMRRISSRSFPICAQCRRSFTSDLPRYSGHNRWSKIRHEKGAADQKKNAQRSTFAQNLTLYSKRAYPPAHLPMFLPTIQCRKLTIETWHIIHTAVYGPDPNMNSQLASVIAAAKKGTITTRRIFPPDYDTPLPPLIPHSTTPPQLN